MFVTIVADCGALKQDRRLFASIDHPRGHSSLSLGRMTGVGGVYFKGDLLG